MKNFFFLLITGAVPVLAAPSLSPFKDIPGSRPAAVSPTNHWIVPRNYRALTLDEEAMRRALSVAPAEVVGRPGAGIEIMLPMPDGTNQRFRYMESSIMDPQLQAQFPDIRTYVGQGIDDPTATLRMDFTPAGFHAQILSASGSVYIDPRTRDRAVYASYFKQDAVKMSDWFCGVSNASLSKLSSRTVVPAVALGTELRTYRMACAATAEYTAFHGGTVALGQAAIVTAINRVNGIYERELAVRMNLVANNSLLVFTNATTDGYTNNDGNTMLTENQTKITAVIGSANYDIGHVFSTGGGGIASLGSVCQSSFKAQGVTGSSSPVGDPFYVDYVCHEVGHQFNADHTFNSEAGSCSGNRNASTAYEVGSGSTILSYAGICDTDDVQPHSDDYFHAGSLDQISLFITTTINACPSKTATGNTIPTVNAGADYTIPRETPFMLTASGSDANGDSLTYCWEEMDLGAAAVLGALDSGSGPLFRSYNPTTNSWRTFPALTNILANTTNSAERLPSTSRAMNFRVTVRDNRAGGGGNNFDSTVVTVATNAGPFVITNFNTSGTFSGIVTVGWTVAGTTSAPVNASHVKIMLSTNGGLSFPVTLTASTPNTGAASVLLPNITNNSARIMVQAANNVFFDINNTNFSIRPSAAGVALVQLAATALVGESCIPTNGSVDPGETVTMRFVLANYGNLTASNTYAKLVATNGILLPGPEIAYGTIEPGGFATQSISFAAGGSCGGSINPVLQIRSGTNNLDPASTSLVLGKPGVFTNVYTNASVITIRDNNTAQPYASTITVAGVVGTLSKITARLRGLNHAKVYDIDALLVGPDGSKVMLMSYCGEGAISSAFLTFDDDATSGLSYSGTIVTGTYKPTSFDTSSMPAPAPSAPYGSALSAFTAINPNGNWLLYVRDSASTSSGTISNGWSIQLETTRNICCDAQPPPPQIQSSVIGEASLSLVLSGAGGVPYATNFLHAGTNLFIPPTNWTRIATNVSDVNGYFAFTNQPDASRTQIYYMIQSP